MLDMDIIDHVAAALGPESILTNLTRGRINTNFIMHKIDRRGGGQKLFPRTDPNNIHV